MILYFFTNKISMTNINDLTIENSILALIDHQPWVAFPINSISPEELTNNVTALAKVAKALNVPTVLTTINGKGGPMADPLFTSITALHPDVEPIDRNNTNAWSDENFVRAIKSTGRQKIVMAGLWTEVCLAQTAIAAMKDGFEVFFVADASGGVSSEAHERACQRLIQAGARPLTWQATMAEWCPDNSTPEYQSLYPIVIEHGGGVSWGVQYIMANIPGLS